MTTANVHPVDERLPAGRLAALGLQHVLVMYAGAIAVPLIVGRALKLSPEQVALLISADLLPWPNAWATTGAERIMLEHIGSVESALGKSMPGKADARQQLRGTLAPVPRPKLARA